MGDSEKHPRAIYLGSSQSVAVIFVGGWCCASSTHLRRARWECWGCWKRRQPKNCFQALVLNAEVKGYPDSADNPQASRPQAFQALQARSAATMTNTIQPTSTTSVTSSDHLHTQTRNCPFSPFAPRPSLATPLLTGLHSTKSVDVCSFTANSGTSFGRSLRSLTSPPQWLVCLLFSPHFTSNLTIIGNPVAIPSITTSWENVE